MSSFLEDAKKLYPNFFINGHKNEEGALELLKGKKDINKRMEVVYKIYEFIFSDSNSNDVIEKWIKTNFSIADTAEFLGKSIQAAKGQINYFNKTIGKELTYENSSIIKFCCYVQLIREDDWKNIERLMENVIIKRGKRFANSGKLVNQKKLLINIPKNEFNRSISDNQFEYFLRLIRPYIVNERSETQKKINEMKKEAGYFNYLMTPGLEMNELDKVRRNKILKLMGEETKQEFKKQDRNKLVGLSKIKEEEPAEQKENKLKEVTEPVVIKTKYIKFG